MVENFISGERLASNVAKDFDGLNSIFCLSNSNKVSIILDIARGKFK
jgi:hypothetical protein